MPLFQEDPANLSKSRLKSDLLAHNVALPPSKSRKEVYVELHLKHINQKNAADFSSDEEDQVQDMEDGDKDREDAGIPDPSDLTDDDLKAALLKHGFKAGPIVASTRALYEKKLRTLLQSNGHNHLNGTEKGVLYSDSEEEEEEENGEEQDNDSESEGEDGETVEQSEQAEEESGQVKPYFQKGAVVYPQCFLPSSRLKAHASRNRQPAPKWNSGNAGKTSEPARSQCSQNPAGISRASSVDQLSGLGSGANAAVHPEVPSGSQSVEPNSCLSFSSQAFSITQMMESRTSLSTSTDTETGLNGSNVSWSSRPDVPVQDKYNMRSRTPYYTPKSSPYKREIKLSQEPVKNTFKDVFPEAVTTPTGIYATCRRPIKGAAERPIQFTYPESPLSPTTLERREVERHLVPIRIQLVVFFIVACLLYLFYAFAEDNAFSPVMALLDSLNQESDSGEGLTLQAETQDIAPLSGQE